MSAFKGTPGPWTMTRDEDRPWYAEFNGESWGRFAEVVVRIDGEPLDRPAGTANANMLFASLDMFEALIEARKQLEAYELERSGEAYNSLQINAAIDKALGVPRG